MDLELERLGTLRAGLEGNADKATSATAPIIAVRILNLIMLSFSLDLFKASIRQR